MESKTLYIFECAICEKVDIKKSIDGEFPCGCGHILKFRRTKTIKDADKPKISWIIDNGYEDGTGLRLKNKHEIKEHERRTGNVVIGLNEYDQEMDRLVKQHDNEEARKLKAECRDFIDSLHRRGRL